MDKKFLKGSTELKNYSQALKFFSLAGTPLSIFLATPLIHTFELKIFINSITYIVRGKKYKELINHVRVRPGPGPGPKTLR